MCCTWDLNLRKVILQHTLQVGLRKNNALILDILLCSHSMKKASLFLNWLLGILRFSAYAICTGIQFAVWFTVLSGFA